jgi:hypothetical protein
MKRGVNRNHWNWFYHRIRKEASCFNGVVLTFIYCGVIVQDVCGNKRAVFENADLIQLYDSVVEYMSRCFKRHKYIINTHTDDIDFYHA